MSDRTSTNEVHANRLLVLHIGDHKTGSTALQSALCRGDISVGGEVVHYPIIGHQFHHNHLVGAIASGDAGDDTEDESPDKPAILGDYRDLILDAQAEMTVLSGEMLEHVAPGAVRELLANEFAGVADDVRVIDYVRPHAGRILSMGVEFIKIGWRRNGLYRGFWDIAEDFEYAPRLESWRTTFGDSFRPRPFVRSQLRNQSVIDDFMYTVLGHDGFVVKDSSASTANESLGIEDLMRIVVVQRSCQGLGRWGRHTLGWALSVFFSQRPSESPRTRAALDRKLAEHIRTLYRADAAAVDGEFFGGKALFVDDLDRAVDEALDEPMSFEPTDWLTSDEIRQLEVFGAMLAAMPGRGWTGPLRRGWMRALLGD